MSRTTTQGFSVSALLTCLLAMGGCGDDSGAFGSSDDSSGDGRSGVNTSIERRPGTSTGDTGGGGTGGSFGNQAGVAQTPAPGAPATGSQPGFDAEPMEGGNTNVALSGGADFGFFRALLEQGIVPTTEDFDAAGFFAEHHTALPEPDCGERICLQTMLGVMGNLMTGQNCTMLQLGLNSPIAANPEDRPPLNLAVVVDVSGSMNTDGKIEFVRQGLHLLIDGMRDSDQITLISYSDNAEILYDLAPVELNRAELRGIVDGLVAEGSTNLHDGLEAGYLELLSNYDSGRQNRVVLLSDGVPTVGITGDSPIMDMSRAYNSDGVGLTTIGLGTDFNVTLMRGLAEQGDGNSYFLENAGAVSEVFEEELSYFTVPVAFDLTLELKAGQHYEFRRAYGSSFWEDTSTGGLLDVPSVFLAHRESDTDVTDDGGRRGGGSALMIELMPTLAEADGDGVTTATVATVDVSFREPGTNELIEDSIEVTFPMAPWELPEVGFFDSPDLSIIQKSFVMLNIYVAFEEASTLFHSGDPAEARAVLESVIAAVEDYNEEVGDIDIEFDLEMLADMRDLMSEQGVQLPGDFAVPVDPWPAD